MKNNSRRRGNTLVITVVCTLILISLAVFILNYTSLFNSKKEAQSAVDAASLTYAKDLSAVVINTPLGRIGLVDDTPALSLPNGVQGPTDPRPIIGYNTLVGTLRLDAIIANTLQNEAMQLLVSRDYSLVQTTTATFKQAFTSDLKAGKLTNKYGQTIDFLGDVQASYAANNNRVATDPSKTRKLNLPLTLPGYLYNSASNINSSSGVATPQPSNADPGTSGSTVYQAYTDYPVTASGVNMDFYFMPLSPSQLGLAPNAQFHLDPPGGAKDSTAIPTAVQVTDTEGVQGIASTTVTTKNPLAGKKGQPATITTTVLPKATMQNASTAEAGGGANASVPSGTLALNFASAGGLPNKTESAIDFTSPISIMNASQCGADGTSPYTGWTAASDSPGIWFQAKTGTGPVPGSGSLVPTPFKDIAGANHIADSDPSVALSFLTYDWLRSLGLRPRIDSVVSALGVNLYNMQKTVLSNQNVRNGSEWMAFDFAPGMSGSPVLVPVNVPQAGQLASGTSSSPAITTPNLKISYGNGKNDPRNLTNFAAHPQQANNQQTTVWGNPVADATLPSLSSLVQVVDGQVTTTDGNNIGALDDMQVSLGVMISVANTTNQAAYVMFEAAIDKALGNDPQLIALNAQMAALQLAMTTNYPGCPTDPSTFPPASSSSSTSTTTGTSTGTSTSAPATPSLSSYQSQISALNTQVNNRTNTIMSNVAAANPRLMQAQINSQWCISVGQGMSENMNALTSIGCSEVDGNHYIVAGCDFYPATRAATNADLTGTGAIADGQEKGSALGWATPLDKNNNSTMVFYHHATVPAVGLGQKSDAWFLPANAQPASTIPATQSLKYSFFAVPDPNNPNLGHYIIRMRAGSPSPFAGESVLNGQFLYQDVHAIEVQAPAADTHTTKVTPPPTVSVVYQVQARDEYATGYPQFGSASTSSNPYAVPSYFADPSAPGGNSNIADPRWCLESLANAPSASPISPICPPLVSEWQLTCPMPVQKSSPGTVWFPPNFTFIAAVNRTWASSTQTGCCVYRVGGTITTTYFQNTYNQPATWTFGGMYFYNQPVPGATYYGNGYYIRTSMYTQTTTVETGTSSVTLNHS